jgi:hypothetical protein
VIYTYLDHLSSRMGRRKAPRAAPHPAPAE